MVSPKVPEAITEADVIIAGAGAAGIGIGVTLLHAEIEVFLIRDRSGI